MKISYFKKLKVLSEDVSFHIQAQKEGTVDYNKWYECQRVLASVINYALSYGRGTLNEKIKVFWKNDCDYMATMEELGVTYEVIRSCMARASRGLYDELGVNVLNFIGEGKPVDAHIEFMVKTGQLVLEDIMAIETANMLPTPAFNPTINMEDCVEELKLIKELTLVSVQSRIKSVNAGKLAHLLAIMSGDGNYSNIVVKKKIWGYLIGKEEMKQMMNDLKVKNLIP